MSVNNSADGKLIKVNRYRSFVTKVNQQNTIVSLSNSMRKLDTLLAYDSLIQSRGVILLDHSYNPFQQKTHVAHEISISITFIECIKNQNP